MRIVLIISLLFSLAPFSVVYSQDGIGGLIEADGEGGEGAAESDSSDTSSRNNSQRNARAMRYIPTGVQQFSQAYPKTHFRFVSGDLLSSAFFETTGLFGFATGDDPFEASVERTSSLGRHAGLLTFLGTATAGAHAINAVENRVNSRFGIEQTNKNITRLKNLAGLNILAGVYGYIAVNSALNGKSSKEVLELLQSKETLAAAFSMHLAFLSADKAMDHAKRTRDNLKFLAQVSQNPRALKIAEQAGLRGGLAMYTEVLAGARKINGVREDLQKAKIAIGATQPQTIPVLVTQTAVEWTAYYVFARVWDSLIHERLTRGLNVWDQRCAIKNSQKSFEYAMNQEGLVYDDTIVASAQKINENFEALAQLMYSELIDQQMQLIEKTARLDYLAKLYQEYLNLKNLGAKRQFLLELMQKDHPMAKLNEQFIDWLIEVSDENYPEDYDRRELYASFNYVHEIDHPEESKSSHSNLGVAEAMRFQRRLKADQYRDRLNRNIDRLNHNLLSIQSRDHAGYSEKLTMNLNQKVAEIESEQAKWALAAQEINGMDLESIEASYEKFSVDPNIALEEQRINTSTELPRPQTIFEITLLQKLYFNTLRDFSYSESKKKQIDEIQSRSELSHYFQAAALENIQELVGDK